MTLNKNARFLHFVTQCHDNECFEGECLWRFFHDFVTTFLMNGPICCNLKKSFKYLCDTFVVQWPIDVKSAVTLEKCTLAEELESNPEGQHFFSSHFQFQPGHQSVPFNT